MNDRAKPRDILAGFLQITTPDQAAEYLDRHPDMRNVWAVKGFMQWALDAAEQGDLEDASSWATRAEILCGVVEPELPTTVYAAMVWADELEASPSDAEIAGRLLKPLSEVLNDETGGDCHPAVRSSLFNEISKTLFEAWSHSNQAVQLSDVVGLARRALDLLPETCEEHGARLTTLGVHLAGGFERTGDQALLDEAIEVQQRALAFATDRELAHLAELSNLAMSLGLRHKRTGQRDDLQQAVALARRAVVQAGTPTTSTAQIYCALASHLQDMGEATTDPQLVREALDLQRQALNLLADERERSRQLANQANTLTSLYRFEGDPGLLKQAIESRRTSLAHTPPTRRDRPSSLASLANELSELYHVTHELTLLEEAVTLGRQALALTHLDTSSEPFVRLTLGGSLWTLYGHTAERAVLDEAIVYLRSAIIEGQPDHIQLAARNNLALALDDLYVATGHIEILEEVVLIQRQVAADTRTDDAKYADRLAAIAGHSTRLYARTGDVSLLESAVACELQALQQTPITARSWPIRLANLAGRVRRIAAVRSDLDLLRDAITVIRWALDELPTDTHHFRIPFQVSLASMLLSLSRNGGGREHLVEASALLAVTGRTPSERLDILTVRADALRLAGNVDLARRQLAGARLTYGDERRRWAGDWTRLRDLAGQTGDLLANLVTTSVVAGDPEGAVGHLEEPRIWLPEPTSKVEPQDSGQPALGVATVWIAASKWETVVISTKDHQTYDSAVLPLRVQDLAHPVNAAFLARQKRSPGDFMAALSRMRELASEIAGELPLVDSMLIVPAGLTAMLPYAAADDRRGGNLIDHCAVTLAPSFNWARAAARTRPVGYSVGAFWPGDPPLDLSADREAFEAFASEAEIVDEPTARRVLARMTRDTLVGHFSCHGHCNLSNPDSSFLMLKDPLTLAALLAHGSAPWLVNLSACDSAMPDLWCSEESISLPTGFLVGGASHVISTLWPVDNEFAAQLNGAFYTYMASGDHPAAALRKAMLELRDSDVPPSGWRAAGVDPDQRYQSDESENFLWWASFIHHGSPF